MLDDSALVYCGEKGLTIITGCSHSGICNITEYAKAVCGDDRIAGIIGGFHLLEITPQVEKTADYLRLQVLRPIPLSWEAPFVQSSFLVSNFNEFWTKSQNAGQFIHRLWLGKNAAHKSVFQEKFLFLFLCQCVVLV